MSRHHYPVAVLALVAAALIYVWVFNAKTDEGIKSVTTDTSYSALQIEVAYEACIHNPAYGLQNGVSGQQGEVMLGQCLMDYFER